MPDLSSAAGLLREQIILLPRASVSPAEMGTLVTELTARRGRGGAWVDIRRRLKTWRERQPAASHHRAGLSLSRGKDEGSGGASWQRVRERGKHGGCSKSGSAEQDLAGCPRWRGHTSELRCKRCRLPSRPHRGQRLCQSPTFWGDPETHSYIWVGLQAGGARASLSWGASPSPPQLFQDTAAPAFKAGRLSPG